MDVEGDVLCYLRNAVGVGGLHSTAILSTVARSKDRVLGRLWKRQVGG